MPNGSTRSGGDAIRVRLIKAMTKGLGITAVLFLGMHAFAQVAVTVHPDQMSLLQSDDPRLAANKRLIFDFWREVFQARDMSLAPRYMAEDYVQHNPTVPTGRQAFVDFFGRQERRPVAATIDNLVAIVAEGDLVILAFRRDVPDPLKTDQTYTTTWFDMLRVADGKIVEHWDYGTKAAR